MRRTSVVSGFFRFFLTKKLIRTGNQTMADCVNALKLWTNTARSTIIYDSELDEFTDDGLFDKVRNVNNTAIIGFTPEGDVFGGFFTVAVTEQTTKFFDRNMFIFSFKSRGRCETPKMFFVKEEDLDEKGIIYYKDDYQGRFVNVGAGGGCFFLGNERSTSWCCFLSYSFAQTPNKVLTGSCYPETFICSRIVVAHLE